MSKLHTKKNGFVAYNPMHELSDETLARDAIWECLKNNDSEGVVKN